VREEARRIIIEGYAKSSSGAWLSACGDDGGSLPIGDLPQESCDPLIGEAEPEPGQVPVHPMGQHMRPVPPPARVDPKSSAPARP
jgi:hypothetical protein